MREVLLRCGQDVTVENTAARAFVQPLAERSEQDTVSAVGTLDGRLWQYLGQTAVRIGDRVTWNGMAFRVRSSRPYYLGDTPVYYWAVLEAAREAAE
jgi:hypothetical protein